MFTHRDTLALLRDGRTPKDDVIDIAYIAGVLAAKRISEIIPLVHPLPLDVIDMAFAPNDPTASIQIEGRGWHLRHQLFPMAEHRHVWS